MVCQRIFGEAESGRQPCEAKWQATRSLRSLKPLGFGNTTTLYETYTRPKETELYVGNKGALFCMIIRRYQSNDLESLTELMSDLGYPSNLIEMKKRIARIHSNPFYSTFVAEMNGVVVGMVGIRQLFTYEFDNVVTQISALVTKKEYRNKGIGRALVRYAEEWAIQEGSDVIVLTSGNKEERLKAHEFYKLNGYVITGYRFVKKLIKSDL